MNELIFGKGSILGKIAFKTWEGKNIGKTKGPRRNRGRLPKLTAYEKKLN